jgi:hypothetical protein
VETINISSLQKCTVKRITSHSLQPSRQSFPYRKENDMQGTVPLWHPSQPCPLCDANTRHKSADSYRYNWHSSLFVFVIIENMHVSDKKHKKLPLYLKYIRFTTK